MFGIDSSEFLLIAIVALVVIGPKDLPRVMRLVGGWVGRGKAMTRHLRSGFDTMMREAELEEMQKQWAKQNADIMAATAVAPVAPHIYDAVGTPVADAVVGDHVYDHPGALPVAEQPQIAVRHPHAGGDLYLPTSGNNLPTSGNNLPTSGNMGPRLRGDDGVAGEPAIATPMTGPQPTAQP